MKNLIGKWTPTFLKADRKEIDFAVFSQLTDYILGADFLLLMIRGYVVIGPGHQNNCRCSCRIRVRHDRRKSAVTVMITGIGG